MKPSAATSQISMQSMLLYVAGMALGFGLVTQTRLWLANMAGMTLIFSLLSLFCFAVCKALKRNANQLLAEIVSLFVGNVGGLFGLAAGLFFLWTVFGAFTTIIGFVADGGL